jgi:hypothetical protein
MDLAEGCKKPRTITFANVVVLLNWPGRLFLCKMKILLFGEKI